MYTMSAVAIRACSASWRGSRPVGVICGGRNDDHTLDVLAGAVQQQQLRMTGQHQQQEGTHYQNVAPTIPARRIAKGLCWLFVRGATLVPSLEYLPLLRGVNSPSSIVSSFIVAEYKDVSVDGCS